MIPERTYPNEFWNSREEHEAHMKMWKSLNHQQKINWIFRQMHQDENGNWHRIPKSSQPDPQATDKDDSEE